MGLQQKLTSGPGPGWKKLCEEKGKVAFCKGKGPLRKDPQLDCLDNDLTGKCPNYSPRGRCPFRIIEDTNIAFARSRAMERGRLL